MLYKYCKLLKLIDFIHIYVDFFEIVASILLKECENAFLTVLTVDSFTYVMDID